jgi:hypothetical protein
MHFYSFQNIFTQVGECQDGGVVASKQHPPSAPPLSMDQAMFKMNLKGHLNYVFGAF